MPHSSPQSNRRARNRPYRVLSIGLAVFLGTHGAFGTPRAGAQDPPSAASARLTIQTTGGATIGLDGGAARPLDSQSADSPWTLPPGPHTLEIRRSGFTSRTERVLLEAGESRVLFAPLSPKSRGRAIARAAVLPGWGSRYMERPAIGWALTGAAVGSAVALAAFDRQMSDRVDEYNALLDAYSQAVLPDLREEAFRAAQDAFEKVDDSRSARNGATAILLGAYALSLGEAIFRFPFGFDRDARAEDKTEILRPDRGGFGVAVSPAPGGARLTLVRLPFGRAAR